MCSSPRFNRGTSVIAALVFAALLGTVALGLHAFQPGSTNTAGLPAQASAPTASIDQTCQEGMDYNLNVGASYSTISLGEQNAPYPNGSSELSNQPVQMCPSDAQALRDATAKYTYTANGVVHGTLPATFTEPPTTSARSQCDDAGNPTTENTAASLCTYTKQADNTYKLQNGNWQCRVRFYDSNLAGNPKEECWIKNVPVGGSVNDTAPANSTSGSGVANPGGATVSANTAQLGQEWCGNGATNAPDCNQCPAGTTMDSSNICQASPQSSTAQQGQEWCGNGATNAPDCNQCPAGTTMDSSNICQAIPGAGTPGSNSCGNGATNPPTCNTCPNGVSGYTDTGQALCQTSSPSTPNVPKGATPQTPTPQTPAAQQSQNPLSSLLSGLARGLSSPCTAAPQNQYTGGNGTTLVPVQTYNPSTGLYSTTYVQQSANTYPYGSSQPCSPLTSAQAPYGVGNNGAACTVPPTMPQCATGATAQPISGSGNGCVTSYQCVPTAGSTFSQTPTPQISCSPQIADVGMSVAISYSCANATGSSGAGFTTNNQTSGSTSTVVTAPPSGTNTANFGLTCTNGAQTAAAQCSVQINQPAIVLVANPQAVPNGQPSSIGWVTTGMQSCVISSPQDATFTASNASDQSVNGVAQTDAITQSTEFDLTCATLGGQTKTAATTIVVGSATSTAN